MSSRDREGDRVSLLISNRTLLYQVEPGDPFVFGTLAGVLLAVAILAGYVAARRAARVDPLETLRAE